MKNFKTNDVLIRRFKFEDVDKIYEYIKYSNKISNISDIYENESKIETQRIIESAIMEYNTEETMWALEGKHTKDLFGFIKVDNYSPKNKICKIYWGAKNYFDNEKMITQALKIVMNYLFKRKGMELIECTYYGHNKETDEILDNIGMTKEAVLKQRRYNEKTNKREDYVIYSIAANEFNKFKVNNF